MVYGRTTDIKRYGKVRTLERHGNGLRFIKRLFYGICILIVAGCIVMLVCALNPAMTEGLSEILYGSKEPQNQTVEGTEESQEIASGVLAEDGGQNNVSDKTDDTEPNDTAGKTEVSEQEESDRKPDESAGLQAENVLYEIPTDGVVTLPEKVGGKTGYKPVWEEQQQIEGTEATDLEESLGFGDTGKDLKFDSKIYPYYAMLEEDMQELYKQIYANAMDGTVSFAPVVKVNVNQLKNVFEAVYNDHPELFWMETGYSCKYLKNGRCVEITLRYYPITNNLEQAKKEFDNRVQSILSGAITLDGAYEKEKYVHNALLSNVEYDESAEMNQSAYSALVEGRSVCAGYARAFQYIMQQLDIPCYYCTGYSGEDHAWNIVKLSDGYYNVDATWDDTNPGTYDYFNKSDKQFAGTHVRKSLSVYLPACNGAAYSDTAKGTPFRVELQAVTEPVVTPEPMEPMEWEDDEEDQADDEYWASLKEAGIKEEEVMDSMEEYYADCLLQMKKAGSGQKQFTNVVPEILWIVIEREYTEGNYRKGYVDQALKEMKMENFAIQLQAQKLGGGYYRLYHNIATWND